MHKRVTGKVSDTLRDKMVDAEECFANLKAFLTQVELFISSFSPALVSVTFFFLISKQKYSKCEASEFQKRKTNLKKKQTKVLGKNRKKDKGVRL